MLDLFLTFFKIGLFTFGGGYAMLGVIEEICVEQKKWITHEEMMNVTVVAESTPGPFAINCATYVGFRQRGFLGSMVTTAGIILPSLAIIYTIAMFLDNFLEITLVANAFRGIQAAVGLLILNAGVTMVQKMKKTRLQLGIVAVGCAVMLLASLLSWNFSSLTLMILAGCFSLALYLCRKGAKA